MININRVTLVGRITKDIEIRKTQSNDSVCSFTVAVDRRFKQEGQQNADFINCVAWRQGADFLGRYASKGTIVGVEGRIQTRSYDGQNGKVYITEVIAENVQIITFRSQDSATPDQNQAAGYQNAANQTLPDDDLNIDPDELPFY